VKNSIAAHWWSDIDDGYACNHTKQAPGWKAQPPDPHDTSHTVTLTTPTGHTHHSTAPPPAG
jgi:hypothetical protein